MQALLFLLPNALIRALAWTLIHSLWQGILMALIAAAVLWLMRHRSAKARYQVAYSALMLLLVTVVFTFFQHFSIEKQNNTEGVFARPDDAYDLVWHTVQGIDNQTFIEKIAVSINTFFNQHLTLIARAWSFGFLFFGLRLIFGWWILRGRQRRGGRPLDAHWQDILRQLQRQLSIARPIPLVEAAWAQLPLTIGWLKPMIFLPIGMVNRLNPTEVEAILAHELAHIAGHDYFFNFLQAFVEVLLYYHPAVWWLSSVIRNERELRCDDVAIHLCGGNTLAYAKMLVVLQEQFEALETPPPKLALAFGKRPSFLLRRVKRLFNSSKKQSTIMEKMMITGLLLCGMFLFSFAKNTKNTEGVLAPPTINKKSAIEPISVKKVVLKPSIDSKPLQMALIDTSPKSPPATFNVFDPHNGINKVVTIIGESQEQFDKSQKEVKKPVSPWTIYFMEFRKNDHEWYTISRSRSEKGAQTDTIDWNKASTKDGHRSGKWDKNTDILSENDLNLKALENELVKDGLIKTQQTYDFSLSDKGFRIGSDFIEKSYYDKYKQLYKKLFAPDFNGEGAFNFAVTKRDTTPNKNGTLAYGRGDIPENPQKGSCYAKCRMPNGDYEEWREVLCQNKITKEVIKTVISTLKADNCLDNSIESDEITKELRIGIELYQKKHKLPVGNLNMATIEKMGIKL